MDFPKKHHVHFNQELVDKRIYDQDVTYVASFDKSTFELSLQELFIKLKQLSWSRKPNKIGRKRAIAYEIESILKRLWRDQTVYDDKNNSPIQPNQIVRKLDRVTTQGLGRMAEIFAGESSGFYYWMVAGKSRISAELGDWRLYEELATASVLESGYASGSGTIVKHGAQFSINDPTNDYWEFGVRDFPTFNELQSLFFRSVVDEPVHHEQGRDVIIVGHAAYLISVSDFEEQVSSDVV